jgi:isocitrate dehydrogenase kinase/phosphatase
MDRATVKRKFMMVKQVDRVGRMADTLEFSNVAVPAQPLRRRSAGRAAYAWRPRCFEIDGDQLIIKHLYIERRMEPLNIHLDRMERTNARRLEHAVKEYGSAIRELAQANIFPGDMLWKNFGVTRYNRVVFYDYDEIEYMTDCNFRRRCCAKSSISITPICCHRNSGKLRSKKSATATLKTFSRTTGNPFFAYPQQQFLNHKHQLKYED